MSASAAYRWRLSILLATAIVLLSAAPWAAGQTRFNGSLSGFGRANPSPINAFVMLIRLRTDLYSRWKATGHWPDDAAANAALSAHSQYWAQQLRRGRALFAGGMDGDYWDNIALIVFEARSQSEAEAIAAGDPAVRSYVFQVQVRPFDVHFITNKFDVSPQPRH